ncbi:MAG TPA: response regulator [Acidimicrobiia bacterium]|jgi:PleD family two-component response regulator|nr:response regulator [Acidimicrobiia bacterium]
MAAKIMVVDDDPAIRRLVELRFQLDDFDVFSTGEPEEAVRLANSERPDAVVLDVMMPGMDGFEVCRRVRTGDGAQPVIVMLTARAGTESMVTGLAAGADDYVVKPPNLDELVERVRSRLRQRAAGTGLSILAELGGGAQIAGEIARRLDSRRPVAVGGLDLRHFEGFNLRYGYDRGDVLLEWMAGLLVDARRCFPGTFVGRLGSDDFVVVAEPGVIRELARGFEIRYLDGISRFYDAVDAAQGGIDVVDDRGRSRREPLLSFSFGAALSTELVTPNPKALLELAVERSRSLRLRARNSIAIGPTA